MFDHLVVLASPRLFSSHRKNHGFGEDVSKQRVKNAIKPRTFMPELEKMCEELEE